VRLTWWRIQRIGCLLGQERLLMNGRLSDLFSPFLLSLARSLPPSLAVFPSLYTILDVDRITVPRLSSCTYFGSFIQRFTLLYSTREVRSFNKFHFVVVRPAFSSFRRFCFRLPNFLTHHTKIRLYSYSINRCLFLLVCLSFFVVLSFFLWCFGIGSVFYWL